MKKGLGKGLGALLEQNAAPELNTASEIDVGLIDVCTTQPRKSFDAEKLEELAESIKIHGVIQPLVLKPEQGRYTIIAGERRFRASRIAGLKTVPAIIKDVDPKQLLELSIIENIQREDLNPIEEAQAIHVLMKEYHLTQEELSARIGKSRSAIANTIRLLALPKKCREWVEQGLLSAGHARALLAIQDKKAMAQAAEYIIEKGFSVRETEEYVKRLQKGAAEKRIKEKAPEVLQAEETLGDRLGTRVSITGGNKRGKISIEYFSQEQLNQLYDFLNTAKF